MVTLWQQMRLLDLEIQNLFEKWNVSAKTTKTPFSDQVRLMRPLLARLAQTGLVMPLWCWFALHNWLWRNYEKHIMRRITLLSMALQRIILFCLTSYVVGQIMVSIVTPGMPDWMSTVLWLGHALFMAARSEQAANWCENRLNIRPPKDVDPNDPQGKVNFEKR